MTPQRHWIVTADGRRASLFGCQRTSGGELHLVPLRSLDNPHEGEHERHRPAMLGGAERRGALGASSGNPAPHAAAPGHGDEEERRRFARELRQWLKASVRELAHGHVDVFAPARMLGLLRSELSGERVSTELHEGDLTHLRPQQLAVHPAVVSAIGADVLSEI